MIAESFERIHRSNLVGMGVLPLQFKEGDSWASLGLTGAEVISIAGVDSLQPRQDVTVSITYPDGKTREISVLARIDTADEIDYFNNGGILHYVIRKLAA